MAGTNLIDKIHEFAAKAGDTDRVLAQGTVTALQAATAAKQAADAAVQTSGNQTIDGVKTFTSSPVLPAPTAANHGANKSYVDNAEIAADNIMLSDYSVSATSVGELGDAAVKNAVDADTLVVPGLYHCTGTSIALHYPGSTDSFVRVWRSGSYIYQTAAQKGGGSAFVRQSNDSGASWNGWQLVDYRTLYNVNIYISKDGSDNNTGFSSDSPVLTVDAAFRIALGLNTTGRLAFCFGPGDWGNITIYGNAYNAGNILVTNYAGNTATSDPGNMPRFGTLALREGSFDLGNVDVNHIQLYSARISNQYYFVAGRIYVSRGSYLYIDNPCKIKHVSGMTDSCFEVNYHSILLFNSNIELEAGLENQRFLDAGRGALICMFAGFSYTGTFSGTKYKFLSDVAVAFASGKSLDNLPGTGGSGEYTRNGIHTGVVNLTDNQTIGGEKIFTSNPTIKTNLGPIITLQRAIKKGSTISDSSWAGISIVDSDGTAIANRTGLIYNYVSTDGSAGMRLYAYRFASGSTDSASIDIRCSADGTQKYVVSPQFRPDADNTRSLGISNARWSQLYAGTATINTSDEREKDNIDALPDAVLDAWGEVNFQQYQFKDAIAEKGENARLHSGVIAQRVMEVFSKYGLDATRYGLLCHDSWEAEDWDETIIDKEAVTETVKVVDKEAVYETRTVVEMDAYTDEDGTEHPAVTREEVYEVSPEESHEEERIVEPEVSHVEHHHTDAGDRYGIRYEEALCMEAAYQRRRADRMEARLAALEAKVK